MNKKTLLLILAVLFVLPYHGMAQKNKRRYAFTPGSDISLSIGAYPLDEFRNIYRGSLLVFDSYVPYNAIIVNRPNTEPNYPSLYELYEIPDVRKGNGYITGAISVAYTYRFKRWFELSGYLTYSGYFCKYYDAYSTALAYRRSENSIAITPMARFVYLNRKYVKLYSAIGLGVSLSVSSMRPSELLEDAKKPSTSSSLSLTPNINLIGVRVGNKVYGFFDLNIGSLGITNIGIGFKLD